jgi:hypothetical protein
MAPPPGGLRLPYADLDPVGRTTPRFAGEGPLVQRVRFLDAAGRAWERTAFGALRRLRGDRLALRNAQVITHAVSLAPGPRGAGTSAAGHCPDHQERLVAGGDPAG